MGTPLKKLDKNNADPQSSFLDSLLPLYLKNLWKQQLRSKFYRTEHCAKTTEPYLP